MAEDNVYIIDNLGRRAWVPRKELADWQVAGYRPESEAETEKVRLKSEYGGRPFAAAAQGAASVLSFGTIDPLLMALDPEGTQQTPEQNPGAYTAGGAGALVLGAGTGLLGGATRAGQAAEAAIVGERGAATLGRKILGRAASEGIQGTAIGGGQGISELARSDEPLTAEGAVSTIGSNMLLGGVTGFAGGGVMKVGEELVTKGVSYAKDVAAARMAKATGSLDEEAEQLAKLRSEHADVAGMDQKAVGQALAADDEAVKLRKAEDMSANRAEHAAEKARVADETKAKAKQHYDEALSYSAMASDPANFITEAKGTNRKLFKKATSKLQGGTDNKIGFIEGQGGGKFTEGLQEHRTVLERVLENADDVDVEAERAAFAKTIPKSTVPEFETLSREAPTVITTTAKDLERRGLFELPGATDEALLARATKQIGEPEYLDQFIKVAMDEDGRMFIDDGRYRLRAALAEGGERPLQVHVERAPRGFKATEETQLLGTPSERYLTPEQSRAYADWTGVEIPKGQSALKVTDGALNKFREAVEAGEVLPPAARRIQVARDMLAANDALLASLNENQAVAKALKQKDGVASQLMGDLDLKYDQIKADTTPSPRQRVLKAHLADLQSPSTMRTLFTSVGGMLGGNLGAAAGGPAGAIAGGLGGRDWGGAFYDRFFRGIKKANDGKQRSIAKAIGGMFTKGAKATAKKVMPKATQIIVATSYANPDHVNAVMGPPKYAKSKDATVNAFHERKRELDAITEKKADGTYAMRMWDMQQLGERLGALWNVAPHMANNIELQQQQMVAYLASKVPRDPTPPHLALGPMTWEPNHAEIAKFARIMQVAKDPLPGIERVADGTCTPDDVETLKAVWPAHYDDIRRQCMDHAMRLQATMPYQQRLSLSILFDIPVDPALTQEVLGVFQRKVQGGEQPGGGGAPPQQNKPLKEGMIQPTEAQRMSAK